MGLIPFSARALCWEGSPDRCGSGRDVLSMLEKEQ